MTEGQPSMFPNIKWDHLFFHISLNTFGLAGSAAQALEYIDLLAATCSMYNCANFLESWCSCGDVHRMEKFLQKLCPFRPRKTQIAKNPSKWESGSKRSQSIEKIYNFITHKKDLKISKMRLAISLAIVIFKTTRAFYLTANSDPRK